MTNTVDVTKESSLKKIRIKLIFFTLVIISLFLLGTYRTYASTVTGQSMVNVTVNYIEEVAVITAGTGGSIKFYMSTDKQKTWDLLENTDATSATVDLSSILQSKETVIYFKGNKDKVVREVKLQGLDSTLKITYTTENGVGKLIPAQILYPVEYRKGTNGTWKTATFPMSTTIYETKGASLQFRYAPAADRRAGKVITVKIPKRSSAPSVTVDGSKLEIKGLKNGGTYYRLGDSTAWLPFTTTDGKTNTMDLRSLIAPTAPADSPLPAAVIEFRNVNEKKKTVSAVKVIEIEAQPVFPETAVLTGTTLKITDPDPKRAYEYVRVERNATFDAKKAKWTTITSKSSVIIKNAAVGDKIYVRLKTTTDKDTKKITPASLVKIMEVTSITPTGKK